MISSAGAGGINMDFSVPDLSDGIDSVVQGRLLVSLSSIEPILRLLPEIEGASGPVAADMNFSGTLADPEFTGHASLVRGTLSHFASGLLLEDIRLAGAVYQYDQTELSGTFRAGDGQGSIRAVLNFSGPFSDPTVTPLSPTAVGSSLMNLMKKTVKLPVQIVEPLWQKNE